MKRAPLITLISGLLILLWVYASLSKLVSFEHSRAQMLKQVFPDEVSEVLIWSLPAIELITAGLLLFSRTFLAGLYLSATLLIAFTIYIALVLSNTFGWIPCSCGGILNKLSWTQHLLFNIAFIILTLLGIIYETRERRDRQAA